jgi:hypothetical protein
MNFFLLGKPSISEKKIDFGQTSLSPTVRIAHRSRDQAVGFIDKHQANRSGIDLGKELQLGIHLIFSPLRSSLAITGVDFIIVMLGGDD